MTLHSMPGLCSSRWRRSGKQGMRGMPPSGWAWGPSCAVSLSCRRRLNWSAREWGAAAALANLQQKVTELRNLAGKGMIHKFRDKAIIVIGLSFPRDVADRIGEHLTHAKSLITDTLTLLGNGASC